MRIAGGAAATLTTPKAAGTYQVAPLPMFLNVLSRPLSCFTMDPTYLDELPHFFKGNDTCLRKWRATALLVWGLTVYRATTNVDVI
jgi:hypothetical protein